MPVRPAGPADVPAITAVYGHHVLHSVATFDTVPPDEADRAAWLAAHPGGRHRVLVAERDGAVVGFAASGPFRPRPAYDATIETSVYLAPDATGQGLGTALYTALFEALAGEDLHRALAVIAQPNPASEALHRSFGFAHVGTLGEVGHKFGRWVDTAWFAKDL
ncbi:GNAT family N-acetyltransferase [Klenkia taihuensis]|uniref:Phosphinothricin acetyltransferase n=1 Tax=Klenkia taihuensis TaxID=1225127 RepID=A0A1I1HB56_9ACTN|nr:GNAT family N-acetyltransferase [Klenkia taihuensis]GHE09377.1 phosphinothricin N-acetyltransferase [Klenkia taihuensis]SFC19218.1 phosphinothricin acetyltransferase [Klenkia taihuensis]